MRFGNRGFAGRCQTGPRYLLAIANRAPHARAAGANLPGPRLPSFRMAASLSSTTAATLFSRVVVHSPVHSRSPQPLAVTDHSQPPRLQPSIMALQWMDYHVDPTPKPSIMWGASHPPRWSRSPYSFQKMPPPPSFFVTCSSSYTPDCCRHGERCDWSNDGVKGAGSPHGEVRVFNRSVYCHGEGEDFRGFWRV